MGIIKWIVESLSKLGDSLVKLLGADALDYILIGAAGIALIAFAVMVIVLCTAGAAKFTKAAKKTTAYLKGDAGAGSLDEKMEAFPKAVKGAWQNYKAAGNAAPAVYLSQDVCVEASAKGGSRSAKSYFMGIIILAAVALLINVIIGLAGAADITLSVFIPTYLDVAAFLAPLAVLILGGIFALIISVIAKAKYKKAVIAYNDFIAALNNYYSGAESTEFAALPVGTTIHSETYDNAEVQFHNEEGQPVQPHTESFAPPVFKAAEYEAPSAVYYGDPQKEDVVSQIERITAAGASKQTMLEVAKLLQAERAKAENKTPEQQKRLNAALATLLRAITAVK